MEGVEQENEADLCNEIDEQGQDHQQEIGLFSHERAKTSLETEPSIFSQYGLRFSGQRVPVPHHGLP